MNKLIKPIAFLFVAALSTGAYAQQGKPAKSLQVKERAAKEIKAAPVAEKETKPRVVNGYLRSQLVNEQGRARYKVVAE